MEGTIDTPPPSPRFIQAQEALAYAAWVLDQASFHADTPAPPPLHAAHPPVHDAWTDMDMDFDLDDVLSGVTGNFALHQELEQDVLGGVGFGTVFLEVGDVEMVDSCSGEVAPGA
jgi:hypothetical protein